MIHRKKQVRIKPKHINKNEWTFIKRVKYLKHDAFKYSSKTNRTTRYIFRDALAQAQKPHTRVSTRIVYNKEQGGGKSPSKQGMAWAWSIIHGWWKGKLLALRTIWQFQRKLNCTILISKHVPKISPWPSKMCTSMAINSYHNHIHQESLNY